VGRQLLAMVFNINLRFLSGITFNLLDLRTCKICKDKFDPQFNSVQLVCSPRCAIEYTKKQKAKNWKKEKKILKEKLKTKSDYEKELEKIFNAWIRERDKALPCISCNAPAGTYKPTAGHYFPAGTYKNIRFNEDNVHGQCWFNCNKNKHGNLQEYRIGLIRRIGLQKVEALERRRLEPSKYSIPELIEMKVVYKQKLKALKSKLV